ncbi:hypothetical protein U9M48_020581 [Paspalum notatum var. saurae]|uniref:Uncharacterized protein n=1 Tax=Paspalum notatum var. saurae TaxID=547442 RepID=A0AAQ3TGG0_PASNO
MAQVLQEVHSHGLLHEQLQESPPQPQAAALLLYPLLLACPVILLLLVRRYDDAGGGEGQGTAAEKAPVATAQAPRHRPPAPRRAPHVSLRDLAAEHRRDGLMLLRLGAVPTLVVSSPNAAQAILRTHDHVFASRANSPVADILFYGSTDVGFAPYGEHWRQVKKIATTHLLTNKMVRAYRHAREQEVVLVMAKIREAASAGTTIDLSSLLNSFTNDIVCHAVSGMFFKEKGHNKLFRELVEANSALLGGFNLEDYFPILRTPVLHEFPKNHGVHEQLRQSPPQTAALFYSLLLAVPIILLLLVRRSRHATSPAAAAARAREQQLRRLPSPLRKLPVIGHLHLVGRLPHVSLRDLAAEHSRDGLMLLRLGAVPTLVVSSSHAAQAILRTYDHIFASRAYSPVTDILFYGSTDVAFAPYGEHWRQVKKIATTHLLTNKKVRAYRHAREQEVRLVMAKIREAGMTGRTIDLSSLLNSFANDIVCHAVSGKFSRVEGHNKLFRELVEANSSLIGGFNLEDYFPVLVKLDMVKRTVCAKALKVNKRWNELLDKLIDDHETRSASQRGDEESDFIDVLLSIQQEYKLTRDHIKAQLAIMFEAGTDTSFIVLEYAMIKLMQNPSIMTKLQNELRMNIPMGKEIVTEDDLNAMAYLKAVIKETLRLHAPAPLLAPHLSMAECDIEGYTIPSGTRVIVNAWALARDPTYWESAEKFMPERFMEGGNNVTTDYKGNDFHYLPFGTGRRICPGSSFAISGIEIMLANLVYHFNWELPPELKRRGIDMKESFGVTVHRKEKLLLVPALPQN